MLYKVSDQYPGRPAVPNSQFNKIADAEIFIRAKLQSDTQPVTYFLYEGSDLHEKFEPGSVKPAAENSAPSAATGSQGSQQGSGQRFNPSPLQMSPRPSGMPASAFEKPKEDDQKK